MFYKGQMCDWICKATCSPSCRETSDLNMRAADVKTFFLICLLLTVLCLLWYPPEIPPPRAPPLSSATAHCRLLVRKTRLLLLARNLSADCTLLREEDCEARFLRQRQRADPVSVFTRSATCQIGR